jgi:hypothetical protein
MAYMETLTRLRRNVASEVDRVRRVNGGHADCTCDACAALVRLLEHLDADIREVRRDVEQIIVGGEF